MLSFHPVTRPTTQDTNMCFTVCIRVRRTLPVLCKGTIRDTMLFYFGNNDVIDILGLTLRTGEVLISFYDDFSLKLGL